jgi:diguanylate cyclase (GGDEF)-like protein
MDSTPSPPDSPPADNDNGLLRQEVAALREANAALGERLQQVMAIAAANEAIWRHFLEIERILFTTRQFDLLVREILWQIKSRFEMSGVVLFLLHPDLVERFFPDLEGPGKRCTEGTWVVPVTETGGKAAVVERTEPLIMDRVDVEALSCLPEEAGSALQSGVWIPLALHGVEFGALLLGSTNPDRYRPEDSTALLEQLGAKIALCMENCLIYEKIKDLSFLDPATGVINWFQVVGMLENEFRRARRRGLPLAVLMVELNGFQDMSHNLGPQTVADVLRHAARVLEGACREGDVIGRYASDTLLLVLPGSDRQAAADLAEEVQRTLRKSPFQYDNTAVLLSVSVGVAALHEGMERAQDLLHEASAGLYRVKIARRSQED